MVISSVLQSLDDEIGRCSSRSADACWAAGGAWSADQSRLFAAFDRHVSLAVKESFCGTQSAH